MDNETLKSDLINWLSRVEDKETLHQIKEIKDGQDWWDRISDAEKGAIEKGLNQLDKGQGIPNDLVLKERKERYGK